MSKTFIHRVQIQFGAQIDMCSDFRSIRVANMRQAHRTKQDGVGFPALGHAFVGKGRTGLVIVGGARFQWPEVEAGAVEALLEDLEDLQAGGHDFRANPVSSKNGNAKTKIFSVHAHLFPSC